MCDLLWSDPEGINSFFLNLLKDIDDWEVSSRGAGVFFGQKLVDRFLKANGFEHIVRAHQLIMEGYK